MEYERDSADIPRTVLSDPTGSRTGSKLSAKLRARIEKLEKWRIRPSSIKFLKDAPEFHGGHATVTKSLLLGNEDEHGSHSDDLWRGEFVAVKVSRVGGNKDLVRALGSAVRETEFLVELSHPNIMELKGFVEDLSKDIIWLVLPWAKNGNLKDFVPSRDWEIPERISLISDVASGLEYLHSREPPIRHGDLKSFNVFVNSEHRALITDFGSARRLTEHDLNRQPALIQNQQEPVQAEFSALSKTITLTGSIDTLRWADPELLNDDQTSLGSDIGALGWITYEVLTDSIPFQDVPGDAVVIERVIKGDLPSINEDARVSLFEELCTLMTRCWNTNPSERLTAKDYLHAVSDMPMVVPENPDWPSSTFSRTSPSEVLMGRGRKAQNSGDPGMAFACFTEAHRIYTRIGDRQGKANALNCLAELHRLRGEYTEAIALYSEDLQIRTDIGDRKGKADALWGLADVQRLRTEYPQAIVLYSEVLQIFTDVGDRQGRADALWHLAELHRLQAKYAEAIALYSEVLQIRTDMGGKQGRADALWGLAEVHRLRKEYSEAIALYSEVLQICTDIGDRQGKAEALWRLAEVHRLRKEYSEAIALYSEVLQICTDIGDRQGKAEALWRLAEVHRLRKEYSEAIALYSEVLQICTDIGNRQGRTDALWRLAEVHRLRKEYSEAIALYSEVLQICTDIGDRQGRADALWGFADIHRLRGEYPEAIAHYSEVLQICTDIGDRKGRADALWGLADVHRLRGEYLEAIAHYSQVLQICTEIGNRKGRADALWGLADVHRLRGEYAEAIVHYSEVLQICTDIGDRQGRADALWGLASVHQVQKEYSETIALYSEDLQIRIDIGDRQGRDDSESVSLPVTSIPVYKVIEAGLPELSSPQGSPQTPPIPHNTPHLLQSSSRQTNQGSASPQPTSAADPTFHDDQQEGFLTKQFATINCVPGSAAEELVDLIQALGRTAPQAVRSKHKIYSVLRAAHDICNYILETGNFSGGQKDTDVKQLLERMEQYYVVLHALEEIFLEFAEILPSEIKTFGPKLYPSWLQSRSIITGILNKLCHPPFPEIPYKTQDIAKDSFFDDCSWLSRLLYSGIDAEVAVEFANPPMDHPVLAVTNGLHYLESQMKYGVLNEQTRELVLDISTLLARALAATSTDHDHGPRQGELFPLPVAERDWLIQALADSFNTLDLNTTLEPPTAQELASKWTDIKASITSRGMSGLEKMI